MTMNVSQTSLLFRFLPYELRRDIWVLSAPPPRIVSLVVRTTNLDNDLPPCEPDCGRKRHRQAHKEEFPVLLHVCAESREIGLKIYTRFSSPLLESGYIDLKNDTLLCMPCHHYHWMTPESTHDESEGYEMIRPTDTGVVGRWIIGWLAAIFSNEVASITSLILCVCQVRPGPNAVSYRTGHLSKFIRAYKNLKTVIFVQPASRQYLSDLIKDDRELGDYDSGWMWREFNQGHQAPPLNSSARGDMWGNVQSVFRFKLYLDAALDDDSPRPNMRCAALTDGEISWEQGFGANVIERSKRWPYG